MEKCSLLPLSASPVDYALVAEKVALLSIMAGDYPTSGPRFAECNACGCFNGADAVSRATAAAASSFVAANVPPAVRTIYLGFRDGDVVRTGAVMEVCAAPANPCRHALLVASKVVPRAHATSDTGDAALRCGL